MKKNAVLVDTNVFYDINKVDPTLADFLRDKEIYTTQTVYAEIPKKRIPKNLKILPKKSGVPSVETLLMKVYDKYHKQIRERKKKHLADLSLIIASLLYDMPIASTDNVFKGNGIEEIIYRYATQIGLNDDEKKEEFKNYILKITKRK